MLHYHLIQQSLRKLKGKVIYEVTLIADFSLIELQKVRQLQKINLQIIKGYPLQKMPLISISLAHQDGHERLYFGTCQEPSNRLSQFHDLDLFVNKAYYFLHKNTQESFQGIIPILYHAFYRNSFTNLTFYGPPGIVKFMCDIKQLIGIRHLAFAALDLKKKMDSQQKYGVGNRESFIFALKLPDSNSLLYKQVNDLNDFIKKQTTQYVIPMNTFNEQKDGITNDFSEVVPIYGQNPNCVQYLVLFKLKKSLNYQWFHENKIPFSRLDEMKEGKYYKDGKKITVEDVQFYDAQLLKQAFLILDFKDQEDIINFNFGKLSQKLEINKQTLLQHEENQHTYLFIIHNNTKDILQSQPYLELIERLNDFNYKIIHIVTSLEFYKQLDKESIQEIGRERYGYYFIDYLTQMRQILPKFYSGRDLPNNFQQNDGLLNIDDLWPKQRVVLPMRMKTMQISKGELFFENLQVKRNVQYSLKKDVRTLLGQLYNRLQNNNDKKSNCELTIFGSASSVETQSRSASSIHLNLLNKFGILLDCGQNTLSQMYFNSKNDSELNERIKNLKIIYLSHFHNDHHQGLMELIKYKCQNTTEKFFIMIPSNVYQWYSEQFQKLFEDNFNGENYQKQIQFLINKSFLEKDTGKIFQSRNQPFNLNNLEPNQSPIQEQNPSIDIEDNANQFKSFLQEHNVDIKLNASVHCEQSSSIKISNNKITIVYSSDKLGVLDKKGQKFIDFAQGCDILIHECTYPDTMTENLHSKSQHILVGHSNWIQMQCQNAYINSFYRQEFIYNEELHY